MAGTKNKKKKAVPGDIIPIRLPQDADPMLMDALNRMANRNQAILNALALVFVKANLDESIVRTLLIGKPWAEGRPREPAPWEAGEVGNVSYASQSQTWLSMINSNE